MTSTPPNQNGDDLLDFADAVNAGRNPQPRTDEERTYLHVHNAMQGDSAAIPSDLKQSTWEDVMSTLALTPEAPVSNRTKRQQGHYSPPRAPKPRRMQWTPLASIAAAALVIIASFGVWFTSGNDSAPPPEPRQVAGIVPTGDIAQAPATPEATAVVDESGNRSIPIIQHVDEQPMDGPVIWLTNAGDVMYDDGTEITTIATEVQAVMAGSPNIIQLVTVGEETTDREGNPVTPQVLNYYNVLTGESFVDDGSFSSYLGSPDSFGALQVLTIADAPHQWSVVNFETMQTESIADLTGGQFRSSESITVNTAPDHSAIAIGTSQYESEGSAILMHQSGLPGEVAVIPADLNGVTWVKVPDDMPTVNNISLSPGGMALALISNPFHDEGASTVISIIDVESGEEIVRTEPFEKTRMAFFQWVEDGEAFIAVNGATIERYALDGSEPTVLLEADGSLMLMPRMDIPDVLHVMVTSSDLTTAKADPASTQFVILNTASGETTTVEGEPIFRGLSSPVQFITTLAPVPVKQEDGSRTLVHPVTGEVFGQLEQHDSGTPVASDANVLEVPRTPVTSAAQAPVSVVRASDRTIQVFNTTTEGFDVDEIDLPGDIDISKLYLSPDGRYLIAGDSPGRVVESDSGWAILDLNNPDSGWKQSNGGQMLTFVEIREGE